MIEIQNNRVLVPHWMTWQRWGCRSEEYFNEHIKGRWLELKPQVLEPIAQMTAIEGEPDVTQLSGRRYYEVQDAIGELWWVHEYDLIQDKKEAERLSWPWLKEPIREKGYEAVAAEIEASLQHRSKPKEELRNQLRGLIYESEEKQVLSGIQAKVWSNRLKTDTDYELEAAIKELTLMLEGVEK